MSGVMMHSLAAQFSRIQDISRACSLALIGTAVSPARQAPNMHGKNSAQLVIAIPTRSPGASFVPPQQGAGDGRDLHVQFGIGECAVVGRNCRSVRHGTGNSVENMGEVHGSSRSIVRECRDPAIGKGPLQAEP